MAKESSMRNVSFNQIKTVADIIIALIAAATFVVAVLIVTTGVIYFKR